jgi:SanA protein
MKFITKILLIILILVFWASVFVIFCDSLVESKAEGKVFYSASDISNRKTALLLGTSKYLSWGNENLYYKYRIKSSIELWESGKIKFFLISGDNSNKGYNEPQMMKEDLVKAGIPKERIYLDYAGFRTFDSVVRAKNIFRQDSLIIISQEFHAERALYIADKYDINADILAAKNVSFKYHPQMYFRELAARTLMILDLYLLGTEPKFSGDKIEIDFGKPQF